MKSIRTLTVLFLIIFVTASTKAQTKMQSGSWAVNQTISGYSLDKNSGERMMTIEIQFDKSFASKPKIFLSLTQIDASKESNLRYNIKAVSVSRDGFTIKVGTWSDSKVFSLSGYWLAYAD